MGGGGKGGQADTSGMMQAMVSAQAAQQAYNLGEQQLQWTQQVWQQEQPLVTQSEQQQIALSQAEQASLAQSQAESQAQWQQYQQYYAPLEQQYAEQAQTWASPQAMALARGQAMADVGQQGVAGMNTAAETLRGYGINPASPRYASLYTSAQPMLGAAEAAAGTTASQNLRLQQMQLMGNAASLGQNIAGQSSAFTQAGTGAAGQGIQGASGAGSTAQSNLSTGSTAMTAPSQWFNAGTNAMNTYVNSVDSYNQSQAAMEQAAASEMGGLGSAFGTVAGLGMKGMGLSFIAKGGAVTRFANGGPTDPQMTPTQGGGATGIPPQPIPPGGTPGGTVPMHASPTLGAATDDVPAMLTANEFVIPKDVATWKGHEYFAKQIDAARKGQQAFSQRGDIGGEPVQGAIPQRPNFVSRPQGAPTGAAMGGAIPAMPMMPA